jgi:arabinan endo-1,5-alpha-L-arabinosidase
MEDQDAIDPGIMLDPSTGRLWVSYGTYFGTIRLIELDPTTGFRKSGNVEKDIAIDCEASDLICRNGWYYLLGTHGTCCDGVNSTYNIVVGRSKSPEGPYIDNVGRDMYHGGGRMVVAAGDRKTGAGHFGRTIIDEGVEVASFHWEADFDMGGRSTLAIRPLLWKNDWPYCGEQFKGGTFEIESERRGYALELAVDFVRMNVARAGGFGGFGGRPQQNAAPPQPVANQTLDQVKGTWPEGDIPARIGDYMFRPHQRWTITPVDGKGAYLGNTYFKIVIEGTERALAATANCEVTTVPAYTGADEQLWRIEQLTDGTFRIMPKVIPGQEGINTSICLYSAGDSTPTLAKYDFKSDNSKWNFRNH